MKELVARALVASGFGALARRRRRRLLPVLMVHGVFERPMAMPCWHQMPVASFRRQMEWVAKRYRVLPLPDALEALERGTLPPRSLALTFDDGYRNVATVAAPVLARLGLPASLFLVTDAMETGETLWPDRLWLAFARTTSPSVDVPDLGLVRRSLDGPLARAGAYTTSVRALKGLPLADKAARLDALLRALGQPEPGDPEEFRLLSWDDVEALRRSDLWTFGGHSTRHEILARMPDGQVASAIGRSHEAVAARTGSPPAVFAYPNGRAMDFDDRARAVLGHLGVRYALSTIEGFVDATTDRLALTRIPIGGAISFARFRLLVSGALESLRGKRA